MKFNKLSSSVKPFAFGVCLLPVFLLVWNALNGKLSANPISDITNETGLGRYGLFLSLSRLLRSEKLQDGTG